MDGAMLPRIRPKRKYICCDLYTSALVIMVIEFSLLIGFVIYYSIMLWGYYRNHGMTTYDYIAITSGREYVKPLIRNDILYYLLLIGFGTSVILTCLLYLGTCWLFVDFLKYWSRGTIATSVYLTICLLLDWIFSSRQFPWEILYMACRGYFVFMVISFRKQIEEDTVNEYDYKAYAQEHFQTTNTRFLPKTEDDEPESCSSIWRLFLILLRCRIPRRANVVIPLVELEHDPSVGQYDDKLLKAWIQMTS